MVKRKQSAASLKNLKPGANLTHGAHAFNRTGQLPPGSEDVKAELKEFYEGIIALYCSDGPNAHQEELLQRATHKLGFCLLCEKEAWKKGPMYRNEKGQAELLPLLGKQYIAYSNSFRLLLRELREISMGKGKKSDLEDYLERTYGGDKGRKE